MPPASEFPSTPLPPMRSAPWSFLSLFNNFQDLRLPTLIRCLILRTKIRKKKKAEIPAPVANLVCSKLIVVIALYRVVYFFWCVTVICLAGAFLQVEHSKTTFSRFFFFPTTTESKKGYETY